MAKSDKKEKKEKKVKDKKDKKDKKVKDKKDKKDKKEKEEKKPQTNDEFDAALEIKMNLKQEVVAENALSVINRDLPPMPPLPASGEHGPSIVLFYQYMEPVWSKKQHKAAVAKITALARDNSCTGNILRSVACVHGKPFIAFQEEDVAPRKA